MSVKFVCDGCGKEENAVVTCLDEEGPKSNIPDGWGSRPFPEYKVILDVCSARCTSFAEAKLANKIRYEKTCH